MRPSRGGFLWAAAALLFPLAYYTVSAGFYTYLGNFTQAWICLVQIAFFFTMFWIAYGGATE